MANGKRGFASMDPKKQEAAARKGGIEAHKSGHAHEFEVGSQEAREAGREGGQTTKRQHGPEFYEAIGRKGGQSKKKQDNND